MKKSRVLIISIAALLAVLSWWLVHEALDRDASEAGVAPASAADVPETPMADTVASSRAAKIPEEKNIEAAASAAPPAPDWSKRLQESDDYWAFAESAIGPASRGDGDARYWLGLALNECEFVYSIFFYEALAAKPPRHLTLDEAHQRLARKQGSYLSSDDLNLLEKRCSRLSQAKDSPFGSGNDWIAAALAVDNPLAQAGAASEKAFSGMQNPDSDQAREARAEARRLSVEAARTGNPEALFRISGAAGALAAGDVAESKRRELSWVLAACLRTADCEGFTQWRKYRCNWDSQCQPYETPRDIIRRDAGSDFDEVERRARELNEKIDAGTLDESDI